MTATVDLIQELVTVADWLTASLLPGTHGPYRPELSADRRNEIEVQRRIDEAQRVHAEAKARGQYALPTTAPLGESPAPMNVEILDLLFEITEWAAAWAGQSLGRRDEDNPAPYLAWIIAHVRAGIHDTANLRNLEDGCEDFITRAHRALGLVEDGQLLRAVCPWCRGITPSHPEGGQRTWRVRAKLPDGKRSIVKVDPKDVLWLVVCESGTCNPPTKDVGTWHRDRPAWMLRSEGDFLAKRLLDIGTIVGEQDLAS